MQNAEQERLAAHGTRSANWKKWGPYVSERAWGTVREDYSADGNAWDFFPHDHARSRAYRWGEDGLAGICDRYQYICLALALWNGKDPILKERLFGLNGHEGNHGEDVKEYYFYLDNTPTHSYMKMLYKYPQAPFPYSDLVEENRKRGPQDFEYELCDTGVFNENRSFDVFVEYAKAGPEDILSRITVINRGPDPADCHIMPTLWFRNTWSWGYEAGPMKDVPQKPVLKEVPGPSGAVAVAAEHPAAGEYFFYAQDAPEILFTENETNNERLFDTENSGPFVKDAFNRYLIQGDRQAVNPDQAGTKCAAHYRARLESGASQTFLLRLCNEEKNRPFADVEEILEMRRTEADAFYDTLMPQFSGTDAADISRKALAGMLWSKQFYYFDIEQWLLGDPAMAAVPEGRVRARNSDWTHLQNFDIISMPDKWEYPWYASWDLAFHCIPLAMVDAAFAKRQLALLAREWYMHPNGQLPAYEWSFGDVNPPVHAWAAMRVYEMEQERSGRSDVSFLEDIYHKMLLNFTWWVNKKDAEGHNIFQGGFLGLDNISVFDRSQPVPAGGHLDQSDATAWMGFYCLGMIKMALTLSETNPVYQTTATKFFEHFLRIARAMTAEVRHGMSLWDPEDGFFYDALHLPDNRVVPLKVRSMVGLMPLIAVEILDAGQLDRLPDFKRRMLWFFENRIYLRDQGHMACVKSPGVGERRILSIVTREKLISILAYLLDEAEFLSPYGIRSLSKVHEKQPYRLDIGGRTQEINYQPAESESGLFGGNSNWRGPIWFPINFLIIEALQKYHLYYGDEFKVAFPTGSDRMLTLKQVAEELSNRLIRLFQQDADGRRPIFGGNHLFQKDPQWRDLLFFPEYFHADNGAGLGAGHQTGWTGLVAELVRQQNS
ncbi:MAG: hypothetical protein U5L07_07075 [Desulfobacterales bacterium]|nr:hypothetical protein [Desulfobacterales bacterium]